MTSDDVFQPDWLFLSPHDIPVSLATAPDAPRGRFGYL